MPVAASRLYSRPRRPAVETATLQINSDAVGGPISIALAGLGQNVVKVLSIPGSLIFSAQTVGSTSSAQQIVVRNTGTATTTVSNVALAGANPSDFAISTQGCATLAGRFNVRNIHHLQPYRHRIAHGVRADHQRRRGQPAVRRAFRNWTVTLLENLHD